MTNKRSLLIVVSIIGIFFLFNCIWVLLDNRPPMIGDDARWLEETNRVTNVVKTGNLEAISQKWQDLFIKDTNSFPRTPLFAVISVPVFLITGPNENAAIIFNCLIFAISSYLLYLLVKNLFEGYKYKNWISIVSVLLFNLFPGYYGFSRLYMSEITQTFLIILISLLIVKNFSKNSWKVYFIMGILLALAMLLRFIMPIYLVIPVLLFIYGQIKLKPNFKKALINLLAFAIGFTPLFLSWYGKNLITYWEFTKFTSSGPLAEITSLGPVFSPSTIIAYWKVVILWHFGWPFLAALSVGIIAFVLKVFRKIKKTFSIKKKFNKVLLILFIIPLPAFITFTFSVNKTARYLLPVEFFWLILIAFLIVKLWAFGGKILKIICTGIMLSLLILFIQGFIPLSIPSTSMIPSTQKFYTTDNANLKYEYLYTFFDQENIKLEKAKVYLIPEQTSLNDAELIWYSTQKKLSLNAIGEFSTYTSLDEGKQKVDETKYVIINTAPDFAKKYYNKFEEIRSYVNNNFLRVETNKDLDLEIYIKVN